MTAHLDAENRIAPSPPMRIAWITPTVGTFGAVREMVEVSNVLVDRGHSVTIFVPKAAPIKWLTCRAQVAELQSIRHHRFDACIGIVDWATELYDLLVSVKADVKAVCVLGFTPSFDMAQALLGKLPAGQRWDKAWRMMRDAHLRGYWFLADSSWQVKFLRDEVGYDAGPPFGGINTEMFRPPEQRVANQPLVLAHSNDPRERKGTTTVLEALGVVAKRREVEVRSYWGMRYTQAELVGFLQNADIFVDGHFRAGWCNPVIEAMACGAVPVCTDIGATADFAYHEQTALVVPSKDPDAMGRAVLRLVDDFGLREGLRDAGQRVAARYDYQFVTPHLEMSLHARLQRVREEGVA